MMAASSPAEPVTSKETRDLQLMWISLVQRPWSSLVVVPTEAPVAARAAAGALSEIGAFHDLGQIETMDAVGVSSGEGLRLARYLAERTAQGKRVVVMVDPLTQSMAGFPLVTSAERALLVLRYGTSMASARATVELVGQGKIIGAVALKPEG
jgi:hypothetical protein